MGESSALGDSTTLIYGAGGSLLEDTTVFRTWRSGGGGGGMDVVNHPSGEGGPDIISHALASKCLRGGGEHSANGEPSAVRTRLGDRGRRRAVELPLLALALVFVFAGLGLGSRERAQR